MDAHEPEPEAALHTRRFTHRVFFQRMGIAWLAALIALGLWQGYAQWLLDGTGAHVA